MIIKGYTIREFNKLRFCEYDPINKCPSSMTVESNNTINYTGCTNKATLSVGHNGKWHICEECASLPEFKKYRIRKEL